MIFQTHIDLLDSLRMLSDTNIVHMDLKDDNIMLNNKNKPIIIDFGLSMDTTNLKTDEELKKAFWIFEDYMPWCFDIIAINSITQSQNNWDSTIIIENDIPLLCNVVIDHCELLHMKFGDKPIFEEAEIEEYKTNIMNYMKSFINQSWRTVIDALLKFTKTWDTYSLCYIYLNLMKVTLVYKVDNSFIHSYIGLLKQNILSTPDKRFDAATMKKELLKISQNINKSDIHKIHETIHTHSKEHGFFDILRQKHAEHTLHLLQKKTKLVNVR
jgi:serine/threonine protein kinase